MRANARRSYFFCNGWCTSCRINCTQGLITWQAQKGETVLINGSSGGVGHFAVQIAKAHGAIVTAVCSGKNLGFVKSLGADHVIVYDQENIHLHSGQYDLVIDTNGNLRHEDFQRMANVVYHC
ncbi:MAG: zinc-binding dehydrogenase [Saprospiraceae bacterium]